LLAVARRTRDRGRPQKRAPAIRHAGRVAASHAGGCWRSRAARATAAALGSVRLL